MENKNKLKIIILESPYETMHNNDFAQLLFGKIVSKRIDTYKQYHGEGVFPLGSEDFVADHIIIAMEKGQLYEPVASIKTVTKKTCDLFGIRLPIENWLSHSSNPKSLLNETLKYISSNEGVSYTGSYSLMTKDKVLIDQIHRLTGISLYKMMQLKGVDKNFAAGLKTGQRFMNYVGWDLFSEQEVVVPNIKSEKGFVYKLTNFSDELLSDYQELSSFWDNRIHISVAPERNAALELAS